MSQVDPPVQPPPAPAQQVVYVAAPKSRATTLIMFVLIVAVLALVGLQVWPHLNLKLGADSKQLSREELINQLDPESIQTPTGRTLELVDLGGKLFEITRIVYDSNDGRRSLVSITVPGKPPQQGLYRAGDSFDRGRITIKEIGDGFVVLKCDGEQRTFGVQGSTPEEPAFKPLPTGTQFMPPKDLGDGAVPAAPTGRVKPAENPVAKDEPKGEANPDAPADAENPEPEPIIAKYPLAREDYKAFIAALPEVFSRNMVLQTIRDQETMRPWGLEIKKIDAYSKLAAYGFRSGDVVVRISDHDIRVQSDIDLALKQSFRDFIEIAIVRGNDCIVYVFEPGAARQPAKEESAGGGK